MLSTMQDEQLSLATLIRYASTIHGDSTVSTWTGDAVRTMTFREVGADAARLARALDGLGVGIGDRVGTFMWNNNEHLVAYAAVPAMGAVLHPLNIRLFPEQLVYVANHAADQVVLVDGSLLETFAAILPDLTTVRHVIVVNGEATALTAPAGVTVHEYRTLLDAQPTEYDYPVIDERSASGMCYTSGTTGDPKGVVYSHRSTWLHSMQVLAGDGMGFSQRDVVLVIVPLFHANGWGLPYAAFMSGASLVLPDRFLQPQPLLEILAATKPTFGAAVPTIWGGLLTALERAPQDISHLQSCAVGGAALPPSMMRTFKERYGVTLLHLWGMTEMSPLGTVGHPPAAAQGDEAWKYRYTQGRFCAGVQARLVNADGELVPHDGDTLGELEVKGPWITGSYYSPTEQVVDADKFDDGWLRTGDIGSITPNGYLSLADRAKDVIKSGGEWISSVDLELAIVAHPQVTEAAVIGIPDPRWDERPLAVVVTAAGASVSPTELRDFLSDKFARWQLPENWTFIDEVPKTSVGKFDKKVLRAQHADGKLDVTTLR